MAQKPKPERADVVIIGAGASGATAAKLAIAGQHAFEIVNVV